MCSFSKFGRCCSTSLFHLLSVYDHCTSSMDSYGADIDITVLLQSDVNAVCFADETGHLIYSGSDDNLCKVNSL